MATTTEKMTYITALDYALAEIAKIETEEPEKVEEVVAKLEQLRASIAKKSNTEHKPTKTQLENKTLLDKVLARMEPDKKYTISEMIKVFPELEGMFPSKVSAVLKPALDTPKDGVVPAGALIHREEIKGKAYFSIILKD